GAAHPPPPRGGGVPTRASPRWKYCAVRTTWRAAVSSCWRLCRDVAFDEPQVELLQSLDHRSTRGADTPAIDLGDGRNAGVGAGDERLLRGVGLGETEVLLEGWNAVLMSQAQHVGAGD